MSRQEQVFRTCLQMFWECLEAGLESERIWDRDIAGELARNEECSGILADGWWQRRVDQIDGLTIHHTLSHSPHATAEWYVRKGGGRPSIPYHLWITSEGEVLRCLALEEGCWHDHTGHENTHLSVGVAGRLHEYAPTERQMEALVRVCRWALEHEEMKVDEISGHDEYYNTACPGWGSKWSGFWVVEFEDRLEGGR